MADLLTLDAETIAALLRLNADGTERVTAKGVQQVGMATAVKIVEHIGRVRSLPLGKHITALGIAGTGRGVSRRLAAHFGTLQDFRHAAPAQLENVEMIGDKKAALIRAELDALAGALDKLEALIEVPPSRRPPRRRCPQGPPRWRGRRSW